MSTHPTEFRDQLYGQVLCGLCANPSTYDASGPIKFDDVMKLIEHAKEIAIQAADHWWRDTDQEAAT
jgi:hypothetical protein